MAVNEEEVLRHQFVGYTKVPVTIVPEGMDRAGKPLVDVYETPTELEDKIVGCDVCDMSLGQIVELDLWICPGPSGERP